MEDFKGIIDVIYEARDEDGAINISNIKTDRLHVQSQKDYKAIMKFINSEIPPYKRKKLIQLFKNFNETTTQFHEGTIVLYYKSGFSDGVQTIFEALPKDLQKSEN